MNIHLSPIISGLIGGALAVALSAALSRWIPKAFRGKSANALLQEFQTPIKAANRLSFLGLLSAGALYQWAGFSNHDWRPLGLGLGLMLSTPLAVLPLAALVSKRSPSEAVVAYCLSQKMPVVLMVLLLVSGIPLVMFSVSSLLT